MGPSFGQHGTDSRSESRLGGLGHASASDLVPQWAELPPSAHADIADLDPFARVLATTDGTVTEILEAWSGEQVAVGWVSQRRAELERPLDALRAAGGSVILRRDVLLVGARSGRALLYAESLIALDRLPPFVRDGLIAGKRPIGRLLRESRIETFREILCLRREAAGLLADRFHTRADEPFVMRTYSIVGNGLPLMLIAEKFRGRLAPTPA